MIGYQVMSHGVDILAWLSTGWWPNPEQAVWVGGVSPIVFGTALACGSWGNSYHNSDSLNCLVSNVRHEHQSMNIGPSPWYGPSTSPRYAPSPRYSLAPGTATLVSMGTLSTPDLFPDTDANHLEVKVQGHSPVAWHQVFSQMVGFLDYIMF